MRLIPQLDNGIDNIIFDLGNVLMDINVSLTIDKFKEIGITDLVTDDIHPHQKGCFLHIETGHITPDEFIAQIREQYPQAVSIPEEKIWEAWNALLLPFDMERFEMLTKLRENYNIYLLSNTNLPHRRCFLKTFKEQSGGVEFDSFFDKAYFSDELLMRKPDQEIYDHVVAELGIDPSRSLFIDDNDCNFSGAEAAGLKWFHLKKGMNIAELFTK